MPDTPNRPKIVILCGPTGIGKTSVAIECASAIGGEIISADSMQVYRRMDIGTAKPTPAETARVPHHLIDVADPDEPFDAARFVDLARPAIDRLVRAGKPVFVVGGTGFYIKALTEGLFPALPVSPEVRERLRALLGEALEASRGDTHAWERVVEEAALWRESERTLRDLPEPTQYMVDARAYNGGVWFTDQQEVTGAFLRDLIGIGAGERLEVLMGDRRLPLRNERTYEATAGLRLVPQR